MSDDDHNLYPSVEEAFLDAYRNGECTQETLLNELRDSLEEISIDYEKGSPSLDVLDIVIMHIEQLQRGERSWLLRPLDGRVHSDAANRAKMFAVDYIKTCRKHGYDKKPMKTITKLYVVTDRTVRNWQKEYTDLVPGQKNKRIGEYLEMYAELYRIG